MANPTTNYGFVLPTSSDLVTDLPADFDVALQGVDTRLKALQPGTTLGDLAYSSATANTNTRLGIGTAGQVLSVVAGVPAWTTGTTGDIEGVTAGVGISGGGTSGTVTVTNSMATAIDAKGDLIAGTGADTFSRLAIGTNNQVLTADSTEATGMKWATAGASFVGCRAYATTDQSMSNGANVVFSLDAEDFDTSAFHSTTTNNSRITIPAGKAGYYLLSATVTYQSGTAGAGQRDFYIQKNGTTGLVNVVSQRVTNLNFLGMSLSDIQYLAVADYIEIAGYQDSGTTASTFTQGSRRVFLAAQYLGA